MDHQTSFGRGFFVMGHPSRAFSRLVILCAVTFSGIAFLPATPGQCQSAPASATIMGHVRNAQGHAVAGVKVEITGANANLSQQTDAEGKYSVSLPPGTYTGRVEGEGTAAAFGPLTVSQNGVKIADVVLQPKSAEKQALGAPEFFDQPQFTIAGVTDTTSLGGHASAGMGPPAASLSKELTSGARNAPPPDGAEEQAARSAADHNPTSFNDNYHAGDLLLKNSKPRDALFYLRRANTLKPEDYTGSLELAEAYAGAGEYDKARILVRQLESKRDTAEVHHLLAEVEEKSGNPLAAVSEFQTAAKLDPTDTNIFDWGAELLLHHGIEPAIEVFSNGNRRFPRSARMLTGLGVASYERGSYQDAVHYVSQAADLNPQAVTPYLILGKMQNADIGDSTERLLRLKEFVKLHPENPWANYYYALALWKRRKGADDTATSTEVEGLLEKALRLDPKLAEAHFQLGVLYSERKDFARATSSYNAALQLDPQLAEAHYRLAHIYIANGQKAQGQEELERYKQASKSHADAMERERKEIQQFVYTMQPR